jgi:hypothetical protein
MNKIFKYGLLGLADKIFGPEKGKGVGDSTKSSPAAAAPISSEATDAVSRGSATPASPQMKKGGKVSSASSRADGCATKGKTKGRFV